MAHKDIVNLVTDIYHPEVIDSLVANLGIEAFSGQSRSTADMTGAGWLCVAALKTVKDPSLTYSESQIYDHVRGILSKTGLYGVPLYREKNEKGDNLLMQLVMYFSDSNSVTVRDIITLLNPLGIGDMMAEANSSGISPLMEIVHNGTHLKNFAAMAATHARYFSDTAYEKDSASAFPFARVAFKMFDSDESVRTAAMQTMDVLLASGDVKIYDFPQKVVEPANNSFTQVLYALSYEKAKGNIEAFKKLLVMATKEETKREDATFSDVKAAVSKADGLKYGEVVFDLGAYAASGASMTINHAYHVINRYRASIDKTPELLDNQHMPDLMAFPVPDDGDVEGYTAFAMLCDLLSMNTEGTEWQTSGIASIVAKYGPGNTPGNLDSFFRIYAEYGSCEIFSQGAVRNMYGPVNIILNKINAGHKAWCDANKKGFADYEATYVSLVRAIGFGAISFEAYGYWCREFGKDF